MPPSPSFWRQSVSHTDTSARRDTDISHYTSRCHTSDVLRREIWRPDRSGQLRAPGVLQEHEHTVIQHVMRHYCCGNAVDWVQNLVKHLTSFFWPGPSLIKMIVVHRKYRRTIRKDLTGAAPRTRVEKIMVILVESGILYFLVFVRPFNTLDIMSKLTEPLA